MKTRIAEMSSRLLIIAAALVFAWGLWTVSFPVKAGADETVSQNEGIEPDVVAVSPDNTAENESDTDNIDTEAPEITITSPDLDDSSNSLENLYYYNKNQCFKTVVTDHDLDPDSTMITYNISCDGESFNHIIKFNDPAVKQRGASFEYQFILKDGEKLSNFIVTAKDYVQHEAEDASIRENSYIVDTTAPAIDINVTGNIESFFTNKYNPGTVYVKAGNAAAGQSGSDAPGSAEEITLTVTVNDKNIRINDSKAYKNKYFLRNDRSNGIRWKGTVLENRDSTVTYTQSMTVSPDTSGDIWFVLKVRDLAGNAAEDFSVSYPLKDVKDQITLADGTISGKVVLDGERPSSLEDERSTPVITLTSTTPCIGTLDENVCLYSHSMSYALDVYDPIYIDTEGREQYSGLEYVSWIIDSDQGDLVASGSTNTCDGEQFASLTVPVYVIGTGESVITVKLTAADRAGNITTYEQKLAIDNEKPRVTIDYDNQNALNGRYFKADRTAEITVEDLNFDPDRTFIISQGAVSEWSRSGNAYTATVTCNVDGDYTIEMAAEDKAGNQAEIDYTNGGANVAPQDFTIDKTPPVITLEYDNNDSVFQNGYYNKTRTATVTVLERNFNPAETSVRIHAAVDGDSMAGPRPGPWRSDGDLHQADIAFLEDADYSGTLNYTDLAGNAAKALIIEPFTVDTAAPEVSISNVDNKAVYQGSVMPFVHFYDLNFDENNYQIRWSMSDITGTKILSAGNAGTERKNVHGRDFSFKDLPAVIENDGNYRLSAVLTDLAGNTASTEEILYSVNRFGSVYNVTGSDYNFPATRKLLKNVYVKDAPALSIRETNPNLLSEQEVDIAVNGSIRKLVEGRDYEIIKVADPSAFWEQYVYNIFADAFTDDDGSLIQGEYNITLYSKDAAGNLNSNRTNDEKNSLNISFVLDKEQPTGYIDVAGLGEKSENVQAPETAINFFWEDNNGIRKVDFYLNGHLADSLEGDALIAAGGRHLLHAKESNTLQTACMIITDLADNSTKLDETKFYLNSSTFLQFLRNPPALAAAITGTAAVIALILLLILKRKLPR